MLVAIDEYSRFLEVEIVYSISAKVVIPHLCSIFARHGYQNIVKTDNGPPFQSQDFASFAVSCEFKNRKILPLLPEANGEVERFMGNLSKFVRASVAENNDWKAILHNFLMHYRTIPHATTKVSPFETLTGRKMNIGFLDLSHPKPTVPVHTNISNNDFRHKTKMKVYAEKRRHTQASDILPGDTVLLKQNKRNKLTLCYDPKPYIVVGKMDNTVYIVDE